MNVFVFDIETVPDFENGARLLGLENASRQEIGEALLSLAKEATGSAFIKHHLQKIIAISAVFRHGETLKIWSLGEESSSEAELIQRFFAGIEKYTPTLVSWNGAGFDLPVLHYRALLHGIPCSTYWNGGELDSSFKYNNYLNRFHHRHLDLMDVLSAYQAKAYVRLDEMAMLLGFPGKMGMSGDEVWGYYLRNGLEKIRAYCEIDVLNTYLIFLKFQLIRGQLTQNRYENEIELTKNVLKHSDHAHFAGFLALWQENMIK